jgi:hypothetical protein
MRACFGVVLILAVAACGDDGVTIDTSASNVCSQIADVACNDVFKCCTEHEIESFLKVTERQTEDQCREDVRVSCERSIAPLRKSLDLKRVKFDANLMNNCLAALDPPSGTCSEVLEQATLPWTEACMTSAWVGIVDVAADCQESYECAGAPDAFCAPTQVCAAKPGRGQPCGSGCAHEFYCASNICQPRLPEGGVCTSTSQCEDKLFCDTSLAMPLCTAPQAAGAACASSAACLSKDCIPGTCAGPSASNCYKDTDCSGHCATTGSFCTTAASCATGTCMLSGFSCSTPTACGGSDICVFPVQCIPGDCIGDPVCSVPRVVADYCDGATSEFSVQ